MIFISHSSHDAVEVEQLCIDLERASLTCWLSFREISPSENYQAEITAAIRRATCMIVVISQHAVHSTEILKELSLAGSGKKTVFPVRLEPVVLNDALSYELANRQWVDLFPQRALGLRRLIDHVTAAQAGGTTVETRGASSVWRAINARRNGRAMHLIPLPVANELLAFGTEALRNTPAVASLFLLVLHSRYFEKNGVLWRGPSLPALTTSAASATHVDVALVAEISGVDPNALAHFAASLR